MKIISISKVTCSCCNGTGRYDEGHGWEECSACNGRGYE